MNRNIDTICERGDEMAYFSDAKEGDEVYCTRFGVGTIIMVCPDCHYALMVTFEDGRDIPYTIEGVPAIDDMNTQTLFYKKDGSN